MTNLGGPSFVFLVFGLVALAGLPLVVGSALALTRFSDRSVRRAFLLTNGAALGSGLVLVLVWALPTLSPDSFVFVRQVVLIYLGTAGIVGVLVEFVPLGIGTVLTARSVGIEARRAVFPVTAAWLVGGIIGVGLAALVFQGFIALLGAPAGALVGAVLGGRPLARRLFG